MSTLAETVAKHIRDNNFKWAMSTPVEETDPVRGADGSLWKNWRHTGDITIVLNGKSYHAFCQHNLPAAAEVVAAEIARDLGIT